MKAQLELNRIFKVTSFLKKLGNPKVSRFNGVYLRNKKDKGLGIKNDMV